jgi:phosphate transport system permease protein
MNKRAKLFEMVMPAIIWAAAGLTLGLLLLLAGFILIKGAPHLKLSLFSPHYNSENVSLLPAMIATVIMTLLSLLLAVPLGVASAIYLAEYVRRGRKAVALIRVATETLSGIPSIVYGLFGGLFFVVFLGWGYSVLAGAFTLAIMILPLIMRSCEEALKSVPDTYREAAYGLGAGRLRTIFRIVLPAARPGLLAGVILAIGRIVGETAALIYTAGTVAQIPTSPLQSARTLSVHMYALSSEGLHSDEAYATALVLLVVVVVINAASGRAAKWIGGKA